MHPMSLIHDRPTDRAERFRSTTLPPKRSSGGFVDRDRGGGESPKGFPPEA
ncbi:hypothetical protein HPP92_007068 [Vanilla planifolia]|nr:hypothetical protein HPP92_007068 [Vanilla planifolia]